MTLGYRENFSPGKAAARSNVYAHLTRKNLYAGKHIVIASEECGDIKHLLFLGVKPSNIIACDVNVKARTAAKELGVIVSPHETIQDTITWAYAKYGKSIVSVNVDLCMTVKNGAPILNQVLNNISKALTGKDKVKVAFTYLRARDSIQDTKDNSKRLRYLLNEADLDQDWSLNGAGYNYQSYTKKSVGSPMSTIVFQPFG